ncbi:MAG: hypothetical protein MUC60_07470 [Oscillatoria sp. Prado101]|jgi:hypothetical protein|nr:hypothetical protein [Oscillatoria sp. Prado101]
MSLKDQWYAARVQRQQELRQRQQQVAAFLQETRAHQQQVWSEERQQRETFVASLRDYVWGSALTPENSSSAAIRSDTGN